jgi:hypothetical protein
MDFSAFSHGQIHSKLWLCEELEKHIKKPISAVILGCWYNVLGFLMLARHQELYTSITGIDCVDGHIQYANKINDAWIINSDKLKTFCADINLVTFEDVDCIICTSTEDVLKTDWFNNIPKNTLVCLQSTNLTAEDVAEYRNWDILNANRTLKEFKNKFPLSKVLFEGTKTFDYPTLKYKRFMLIGKK